MSNPMNESLEKAKGKMKQIAGDALDDAGLRREGEAQEDKAENAEDARKLEEMAAEKRREAAENQIDENVESRRR